MEVLSSRVLLRPSDLDRSIAFYRETLGLPVYREFGDPPDRGVVFFLGGGFLEVSGRSGAGDGPIAIWLQVRDLNACHAELADAGVTILEPPGRRPWGLDEMWIADPDGIRLAIIEVPPDHPLRRR
jgi:catechol 2,3-dioxygenase-like lactoylglutathione lyase family enzyme